jgi:hypothetical protein
MYCNIIQPFCFFLLCSFPSCMFKLEWRIWGYIYVRCRCSFLKNITVLQALGRVLIIVCCQGSFHCFSILHLVILKLWIILLQFYVFFIVNQEMQLLACYMLVMSLLGLILIFLLDRNPRVLSYSLQLTLWNIENNILLFPRKHFEN